MDHDHILTLEADPQGPEKLERSYRDDRTAFVEALPEALAARPQSPLLRAWTARFVPEAASEASRTELWVMILLAVLAGLFIKLPEVLPVSESEFYSRNVSLGPLGALIAYLLHSRHWPRRATMVIAAIFGITALYFNLLPDLNNDATIQALVHGPLFLWCVAAMAHAGDPRPDTEAKRSWIRFFGELIVFSGLLFLGGAILTLLTAGLFELIDAPLSWIWEWMVPMGGAAIPIVAAWAIVRGTGQGSAGARIMPILARIFAPLFLIVLTGYLLKLSTNLSELFENRDTLFMYNVLLLSVLGLCVFSLSGQRKSSGEVPQASENRWLHLLLAVLAGVTVIFDVIGLAAIMDRILSMGLTPNRLVVLGANLAVLGNLLLLLRGFAGILNRSAQPAELERITGRYLPVYAGWSLFVCLCVPLLF